MTTRRKILVGYIAYEAVTTVGIVIAGWWGWHLVL
jgi:hypothetical protein